MIRVVIQSIVVVCVCSSHKTHRHPEHPSVRESSSYLNRESCFIHIRLYLVDRVVSDVNINMNQREETPARRCAPALSANNSSPSDGIWCMSPTLFSSFFFSLSVVVVFHIKPFFLPNDISSTPSVLPDSSS